MTEPTHNHPSQPDFDPDLDSKAFVAGLGDAMEVLSDKGIPFTIENMGGGDIALVVRKLGRPGAVIINACEEEIDGTSTLFSVGLWAGGEWTIPDYVEVPASDIPQNVITYRERL